MLLSIKNIKMTNTENKLTAEEKELVEKYDNWVLGDWHEDTDWILTEWEIEWLPELVMQDTLRFDYNQWKQTWSKKSCTIFAWMGAISDLMNYEFSLDELKEADELSYTMWRTRWQGWYIKSGVECACKYWNSKHPDKPVVFYTIAASDDDKANAIINKNYDLNIWINYTLDYAKDVNDNLCVDRAEKWQTVCWHAICQIMKDWIKTVKDNYKWSKQQYYKVKVSNEDLWKAGILQNYCYVIVKVWENNLSELKRMEEVKTACLNALEANSKLWNATNDETLRKKLHDTNEWIRNNNLKYIETMTAKLRNNE